MSCWPATRCERAAQKAAAKPAAPPPAAKKVAPAKKAAAAAPVAPPAPGVAYERVWESTELKKRDLNIPDGKNTKPTGSINLDKGRLPDGVDFQRYFRNVVFSGLAWTPTGKATVDEAFAKFQLVLKGISYGEFDLRIGHTTKGAMYTKKNAVTRLSWGPLRDYVRREDLLGRTLALYRDKADPKRFVLEID